MNLYSNYLSRCNKDEDGFYNEIDNHKYTKVDNIKSWNEKFRCVIHLYPDKDTTSSNGDLNGFDDSLFFIAAIYNETRSEYYVARGRYDNVNTVLTNNGINFQIRLFKDGSPMIIIEELCKIRLCCNDIEIIK